MQPSINYLRKPLKLNGFLRQDNRVSVTSLSNCSKKVKIEPVQSGSSPEKMKCFILFLPLSLVGRHQEFNLIALLQLDCWGDVKPEVTVIILQMQLTFECRVVHHFCVFHSSRGWSELGCSSSRCCWITCVACVWSRRNCASVVEKPELGQNVFEGTHPKNNENNSVFCGASENFQQDRCCQASARHCTGRDLW